MDFARHTWKLKVKCPTIDICILTNVLKKIVWSALIPQEIEAIKFLPTLKYLRVPLRSDNLLMTFLITVQPSLYEVPD